MNDEGNVIGIISATNLDRKGNNLVVRGTLPFFGKPIIELTYEALDYSKVKKIFVYTIKKGIVIKDILGKKVRYILKSNEYIYNNDVIQYDLINNFSSNQTIIFIDPKYPLIDSQLIDMFINYHFDNNNDISIIEGYYNGTIINPNIFITTVQIFNRLINNTHEIFKHIDINKIFEYNKNININVGVYKVEKIYNILSLTNLNLILNVESIFLKRK